MTDVPRVVVSAPSSGHGKTAVAVGLLAALTAKELKATGFKLGSDYVDASYLGMACGSTGRNLDPRLTGTASIPELFAHGAAGSDIAVVEGTMGVFDGTSAVHRSHSTAHIAQQLRAPVVLVIDAATVGQSIAALVHGFKTWDELLWVGGVILTRVGSQRHEQILRDSLADVDVPVLGAIPRSAASLPARQHGMLPVVERSMEAVRAIRRLGEVVLDNIDLDRLLAIARSAPRLPENIWSPVEALAEFEAPAERPLVAVAGGSYFTYSYAENVELLQAAGADVAVFDPLRDERLPQGAQALVFGGGFPEWYVEELSSNIELAADVTALVRSGAPVAAESSGLVWLSDELDDHPMAGVIPAAARTTQQVVLGYREATACATNVLMPAGTRITGYKHHRTQVSPRAGEVAAWVWEGGREEGYIEGNVHASYLNLHWAAQPRMAGRFVSRIPARDGEPSVRTAPPQD